MKEIIENYGLYICIGLGALILLVIIILIITSKKKKPEEENNSSILDVNIDGVVESDFKYGYAKEDTVVIKPDELEKAKEVINENSVIEEQKDETPVDNKEEIKKED